MHLPDGFLDAKTSLLSAGVAAAGLGVALRQVRTTVSPRQMPVLGLAGAFVFAAQMLNFPVGSGTSGHLMGGTLLAILLGPSAAIVVMTCVLLIQALVFADGGLTALGANLFNIGIVPVGVGYLAFRLLKRLFPSSGNRGTVCAAAFAGWFGTVVASITCAGQLALSGNVPWQTAFPAMAAVHMVIGIGEGLATGLIVLAILRARPEIVAGTDPVAPMQPLVVFSLLASAGLALFVAPFASPWPDGLEKVASTLGLEQVVRAPAFPAPLPEYQVPFVGSPVVATSLAGLAGTALAFLAAYALARVLVPALPKQEQNGPPNK